jgi:hypothetical protein
MSVHCDINKQRNACTSASILALCFSHRMALAASHHMNLATQRTNTSSTNTIILILAQAPISTDPQSSRIERHLKVLVFANIMASRCVLLCGAL